MEKVIGNFLYHSSFSRNELSSVINDMVDYHSSIGLHSIGFTSKDKKEVASKISREGLRRYPGISAYSTVRFFGRPYRDNHRLNEYRYDQTDSKECIIIVAIPEKFTHSSGQVIDGGPFPEMTVGQAKKELDEFNNYMNESDRVFRPIPSELILGCYTFDSKDIKYEPRTIERTIALPYGGYTRVFETDPYYKRLLGDCDFYINPNYYEKLPQEEKDRFIRKYFKIQLEEEQKQTLEKPKFIVKRRTFPNQ